MIRADDDHAETDLYDRNARRKIDVKMKSLRKIHLIWRIIFIRTATEKQAD